MTTSCQDPLPLNSAVIVRVWPRPFSVWEDNPEDPESIDGYFLLDVNEQQAQDECADVAAVLGVAVGDQLLG